MSNSQLCWFECRNHSHCEELLFTATNHSLCEELPSATSLKMRVAKEVHNNATILTYEDNPWHSFDLCFVILCRVIDLELRILF